jgi:hypothetical protein
MRWSACEYLMVDISILNDWAYILDMFGIRFPDFILGEASTWRVKHRLCFG